MEGGGTYCDDVFDYDYDDDDVMQGRGSDDDGYCCTVETSQTAMTVIVDPPGTGSSLMPRSQSYSAQLSRQLQMERDEEELIEQERRTGDAAPLSSVRRRLRQANPPARSQTCSGLADLCGEGARSRAEGNEGVHKTVTRSVSIDTGLSISSCLCLRTALSVRQAIERRRIDYSLYEK
jgi:hypothetical protein